mgnify:FL=1
MQEEIYTKEEYYYDWKGDNIAWLKDDFLEENIVRELHKENIGYFPENILKWIKKAIRKTHNKLQSLEYFDTDEFEAYCQQAFRDRMNTEAV